MDAKRTLTGTLIKECRYGENAIQAPAGLYAASTKDPLALGAFTVVEGADPSFNNWAEIDRQLQTMTHIAAAFARNGLPVPAIALGTKHGNPCGAGVDAVPVAAVTKMLWGDPRAIFGGLVMLNMAIDATLAHALIDNDGSRRLLDGVIAPRFDDEAIEILSRKGGKCRLVANPALGKLNETSLDTAPRQRYVRGGFLEQPNYTYVLTVEEGSVPSVDDALLAWAVGATSNSNTVTLVAGGQLIGNGVGQQDRVSCCELALKRARDAGNGDKITGATAYSDSFFPFPDGPEALIKAGITTIVATSGSVRDGETQQLCADNGVALVQVPDSEGRGFFGH